MATKVYPIADQWTVGGRIEFTEDTDIRINNTSVHPVFFEETDTGSAPNIEPKKCSWVSAGSFETMRILAGKTLHFAGDGEEVSVLS